MKKIDFRNASKSDVEFLNDILHKNQGYFQPFSRNGKTILSNGLPEFKLIGSKNDAIEAVDLLNQHISDSTYF